MRARKLLHAASEKTENAATLPRHLRLAPVLFPIAMRGMLVINLEGASQVASFLQVRRRTQRPTVHFSLAHAEPVAARVGGRCGCDRHPGELPRHAGRQKEREPVR